jgi:predicted nucleic acid-binding protein
MRIVFADTFYWVALSNPNDQWYARSLAVSKRLGQAFILTTDSVLVEFLNFFSSYGPRIRDAAASRVNSILTNPNIEVVPQERDLFLAGLSLYEKRLDKGYSLTDCISMIAMRERAISEVLTNDDHFAQEGFALLIK